jgi:catechol-2,3-dioxygenase
MAGERGETHAHLVVSDLERASNFYRRAFAMEEIFREGPRLAILQRPGAEDTITLNARPGPAESGRDVGVAPVGFRLPAGEDLEACVRRVVEAGGTLLEKGDRSAAGGAAYVTDPDGYLIVLRGL